ncbi:hypothetical protein Tco_0152054 [Tanacetum coccineum]
MSNTNNTMQTQTSNALHNAIMEPGGKDRPPILAPGNYVQWKFSLKRYIDTKPNKELLHYCLDNLPYEFQWVYPTTTVAEDGINNDIYSTVDACPNACEMWKAIERLKQGESINVQDLETNLYWEFGKFTSWDGESLESYYSRFYKMMNELVRNKCQISNHKVNVQFLLQLQQEWQRFVTLVKQSQELKSVSYHKLYDIPKQHQNEVYEIRAERQAYDEMSKEKEIDKLMALISLSFKKIYKPINNNLRTSSNTSRANQDNSSRTSGGTGYDNQRAVNVARAREIVGTQELEAHYLYMAKIQEISPDAAANSGPIFDAEPLQKVQYDDDNYDIDYNVITTNGGEADHDNDDNDLVKERDLLASLIDKLKCKIDDNKTRNKLLESSNKILVDKLKSQIKDFKNKNKSLESSNHQINQIHKEANNELSKTNQLMFKDLKKFQAELDRYHDVNYTSKVEINCEKAKRDLMSYKMESEKESS